MAPLCSRIASSWSAQPTSHRCPVREVQSLRVRAGPRRASHDRPARETDLTRQMFCDAERRLDPSPSSSASRSLAPRATLQSALIATLALAGMLVPASVTAQAPAFLVKDINTR